MSDEFDTLYASYAVKLSSIGGDYLELDEYEKSTFLTLAQDALVTELYSGKNVFKESFESTEENRRYLDSLIKDYIGHITVIDGRDNLVPDLYRLDANSKFIALPDDLLFIVYETLSVISEDKCDNGKTISIVPVTLDSYIKTSKNPFKGSTDRRALRIDRGFIETYTPDNEEDPKKYVEIVSKYPNFVYYCRYIKDPDPIILIDLENEDLSIKGKNKISECKLHSTLHKSIVERAVTLALSTKTRFNGSAAS